MPKVALAAWLAFASVCFAQDILHRSPELKREAEEIYKRGLHKRLDLVVERGYYPYEVSVGWGWDNNWSDLWGPSYPCPLIEHIGQVGDGGKWICGVSQLLQREGCVIYSIGSFDDYQFEAEMLNRTVCDIHVFDPTVLPSLLRQREQMLNAPFARPRIWWHSIGIAAADDPNGALGGTACYGGQTTLFPMANTPAPPATPGQSDVRQVVNDLGGVNTLWQPGRRRRSLRSADNGGGRKLRGHRRLQIDPNAGPFPLNVIDEADQALVRDVAAYLAEFDRDSATCAAHDNAAGVVAPSAVVSASSEGPQFEQAPHGDVRTHCDMRSLHSIMQLGHTWLDVFKIDVEGSEYETFAALAQQPGGLPFTQLQVEVHWGFGKGMQAMPNGTREQLKLLLGLLQGRMRTMFLEPNIYHAGQTCMEFAMIQADACGNIVTPTTPSAAA